MQRREAIALGAAMLSLLVAAARLAMGGEEATGRVTLGVAPGARPPAVDDDSLGAAAANTAGNDPFRLVNRPSQVRYDARTESGIGGAAAFTPPIRPPLAVKAIIGGPPWQAMVDGIPGQPAGTIVRSGVTFDKLTVRSVGKDTVVIQAPDTTWKLTLSQNRS